MLKYHDAPLFYVDILSYLNLLFTTLFTIEAILKIFGYGPKVKVYFNAPKNILNSDKAKLLPFVWLFAWFCLNIKLFLLMVNFLTSFLI